MKTKTIVAFNGQQGSGKSSHVRRLREYLESLGNACHGINLKDMFSPRAQELASIFGWDFTDMAVRKNALLAVSTFGESISKTIWSDHYVKTVVDSEANFILTDDIRTEMNLDALEELSKSCRVILFQLFADEQTRKSRVSIWRDAGGYTEQILHKREKIAWYELDTTKPIEDNQKIIRSIVLAEDKDAN